MFSLSFVTVLLAFVSFVNGNPIEKRTNTPILVNVRIEGPNSTIFEAPVLTQGHNVTTASGGNHHCDGTNFNVNPTPGATETSALADAAKQGHFTFDG